MLFTADNCSVVQNTDPLVLSFMRPRTAQFLLERVGPSQAHDFSQQLADVSDALEAVPDFSAFVTFSPD
jgi:hypothetical protein